MAANHLPLSNRESLVLDRLDEDRAASIGDRDAKLPAMRNARAKIVNGKVVTRARFPEGTKLLLVVDEPESSIELTEEDEIAVRRARASIRAGRSVELESVMALLRRL